MRWRKGDFHRDRAEITHNLGSSTLDAGAERRPRPARQMSPSTWIRNASWVIAWDAGRSCHVYLKDADVVFSEHGIHFVGRGYSDDEHRATVVDGRDRMVMPGLVNIHSHPTSEPLMRGLTEERKSRQLGMSTLYEYIVLVGRASKPPPLGAETTTQDKPLHYHDPGARSAAARMAIYEMLKSGVTTFVDYSPMRPDWIAEVAATGIRAVLAPQYRSAYWYTPNGHEVFYEWDEQAGQDTFCEALELVDEVRELGSDRLSAMVAPGQVDTCTPELIRASHEAAVERDLAWTIHAAQSMVEFREMFRRHGKTPIEWLKSLGVLGPHLTIGHAIFCDHHSWLCWPDRLDLDRIASSGASVAHCPNVFARGGTTLQDFGRYRRHGVNLGLGTDTNPHNLIDEMRWAAVLCKVAAADVDATSVADVFHAATVGGARALRRDDIGRLEPGCRSDIVVIDTSHPYMQPLRDPLRTMVFSALERAVLDVYVQGRQVVAGGEVLTIDIEAAAGELNAGQRRALPMVPAKDWAGRTAEEAFPLALPVHEASDPPRGPRP